MRQGWSSAEHERGAVSLERVGILVVSAILVGALVVVLSQRTPVGDSVRQAVCSILNLGGECGSGSTTTEKPEPTEPCTVADSRVSRDTKVAIIVVTLRDGRELQVEQLSDGTYRVTTGTNNGAGAEVGVGGGVSLTVADRKVGGQAGASTGAEVTIKQGDVYNVKDEAALKDLVKAYSTDTVKDQVVGDSGPIRWATDKVTDGTGLTEPMPEADEEFVEGGFSVNASASAASLTANGNAGVETAQALGYKKDNKSGSKTFYLKSTVKGEAGLKTLGVDTSGPDFKGASFEGEMEMVTAVTVSSDGKVESVGLTVTEAGSGDGMGSAIFTGKPAIDTDDQAGRARVYQAELPMDTQDNQVAGWSLLGAQGVNSIGGVTAAAALPATTAATLNYFDKVRDSGTMTQQDYDNQSSTPFAVDASGKLGIEAGVAASVKTKQMNLTDAQYWDGSKMSEWTGCTAAAGGGK